MPRYRMQWQLHWQPLTGRQDRQFWIYKVRGRHRWPAGGIRTAAYVTLGSNSLPKQSVYSRLDTTLL